MCPKKANLRLYLKTTSTMQQTKATKKKLQNYFFLKIKFQNYCY